MNRTEELRQIAEWESAGKIYRAKMGESLYGDGPIRRFVGRKQRSTARPQQTKTCKREGCDVQFPVTGGRTRIYCSDKCRRASHNPPRSAKVCEQCGVSYTPARGHGREQKFCGTACSSKAQRRLVEATCIVCKSTFRTAPYLLRRVKSPKCVRCR